MIGQTLSHFKIIAKLGEGGMGEVYLAQDGKLKREVALKVLPHEMASSPERLARFQREAEAVAALNHPNIVTIHSIEEADGVHFLTMELVDGESLDRTLERGALGLSRALEVSASIASALAVAHERGIVHRDLKPANVMLTRTGEVKILDFGLARIDDHTEVEAKSDHTTEMPTEARPLTEEGMVMGTAPYMAPEQAQGLTVDARSDIFSLGSMLYESVTGRPAFRGSSSIDTLHKVIYEDPAPLAEVTPHAPIQMQWILRKALAKDPAERYQSAGDLAVDLRAAMKDLESDPRVPTAGPGAIDSSRIRAQIPRSRLVAIAGAFLAVVIGLVWLLTRETSKQSPVRQSGTLSIRKITSSGTVVNAALSPDGKYVAYVESYEGVQSLHLRQVGSMQSLTLVPRAPARAYWGVSFTPDSKDVIFGIRSEQDPLGAFYRTSALGGVPRKLLENIESEPSFSPDGSRFTFLRRDFPAERASAVMIADADGSNVRLLASREPPEVLAPRSFVAPSWSPDGTLIAASVMSEETGLGNIQAFDVETGDVVWTSEDSWHYVSRVAWLPEGDALLAIATPDDRPFYEIWHVPYPQGTPHQITDDPLFYRSISVSADGASLITVGNTFESSIWAHPADGSSPSRISHTVMDGRFGFDFMPDGRVVFQTVEGDRMELAVMNADGTGRQILTDDPQFESFPRATPDGSIIYCTGRSDGSELRLRDPGTSESRSLSILEGRYIRADLSPDGVWAAAPRSTGLWRVPLDGSEATRLTSLIGFLPAISPEGTRVAFYYDDPTVPGHDENIGIVSVKTGEIAASFEPPAYTSRSSSLLRWAGDGEALVVNTVEGDRGNLWRVPLDGGEPERLTDLTDEHLFWFEYSPNGDTLLISSGRLQRDAMLFENFR